jgi:cephalosporin-C deacetylase
MLTDWPLETLELYVPALDMPEDFDAFWDRTIAESARLATDPTFVAYGAGLSTVEVYDVTFSGFGGQPVRAWLLLPRQRRRPLPCVVEYLAYLGGRGLPHERLLFSAAGYAHMVMDTRGQGTGSSPGDTNDPDPVGAPAASGYLTRGVGDRDSYFYRRVFTDAVGAVAAVRQHPAVDADRIVVAGYSQGGGIALAAAALIPGLAAALIDVPFLCHYPRAVQITDNAPYQELVVYCRTHRDSAAAAMRNLRYFDGVNLATRATAPALFSVALMDPTCPPSTVFAAYNHYRGDRQIRVWPYNGHEGGGAFQRQAQLQYLADLFDGGGPSSDL